MKIIDKAVIKDKYDCIIIGAGIGGLTAAALLAKKGIDTLLIEQHYLPGGACTSLKKMGQAFDVGAALLFGWGSDEEEGFSPHKYIMNTLEEPINVIPHDSIYRCMFKNDQDELVQITFWKDFDRFFSDLVAAFPEHEEGLKNFYEYLEKAYQIILKLDSPIPVSEQSTFDMMKMFFKGPIGAIKLLRMMNKDMKSIIDKFLEDDPRIKTFYDMLLSLMLTTRVEETPVILAAAIFSIPYHGGACYPQGSPQMLPNAIERAFERYNGTVIYRNLVENILINDNKTAYGVKLAEGTEINSNYVISDATIWQNYNKLIDKKHLSDKQIDWANSFLPTLSALVMYIGVKEEAIPPNVRPIEMYIEDISNYEGGVTVLYIPSIEDPSICPKGTHSITVIAQLFEEFPNADDPEYQSDKYYELKEKETNRILNDLEKWLPNLRDNIITMEVGTPSTIERFTLREFGSIGGPKQAIGQHMMNRPGAKSNFKNLFYVGDSTTMGEGVVSTSLSAVGGANMILKREGKKIYKGRKFDKNYVNFVEGKPRAPMPKLDEELDEKKAKRVAMECQWCLEAECMNSCPAGVDVPNFMRRIESNNFNGAARSMREMNPLAEICGHICPAENLCQKDCNHKDFSDEPARIPQLQSWVCKKAGKLGWNNYTDPPNGKKIAIIGSGPAGLSCAYYLAKLGYNIDVYEKRKHIGGMITNTIPSFRLPKEAVDRDFQGISLPTINFKLETELGIDITIDQLEEKYDATFIATGLWNGRTIQIPGLEPNKVIDALSFIQEYKKNGKVEVDSKLLVIGGGSVAADAATVAKKSRIDDITMVCLESKDEMPALIGEIDDLLNSGIILLNCWGPKEVKDNKMIFKKCVSVFDKQGNFKPKFDESESKEVEFDTIVMAVGQDVEENLSKYLKNKLGITGLIEINPHTFQIKNHPNIYAGGDVIRGAGTVVQSVADGRKVARAIYQKFSNH
jgi:phytoene dehydrogenase-like protein